MAAAGARPYAREDYLAIKAATRRACEEAGPLTEIAARTRVDPARLSLYGNVGDTAFVPVDVAMDLDRLAGGHPILAAWAERCGLELTPHDLKAKASRLADHMADIVAEMSGVTAKLAEIARGIIAECPRTAAEVERKAAEAMDALQALREDCLREIARGGRAS